MDYEDYGNEGYEQDDLEAANQNEADDYRNEDSGEPYDEEESEMSEEDIEAADGDLNNLPKGAAVISPEALAMWVR